RLVPLLVGVQKPVKILLEALPQGRCLGSARTIDLLHHADQCILGFVFQSFLLIPQLTVLENIELPMIYAQRPRDARIRRARELIEQVGLDDRAGHRPAELSGGQRQRAAIARALANDPPVLLADEPTGNLDSRTGAQILDLLDALNRTGRTIVLVTHEREVSDRAHTTLHVRDGTIERVERP
ncbi:MAG: ATP-binding cassette domain-containing protein, partial [Kiritimatiellae bacterium]|nr:ATP-binding cassette domain-containing protein [Kiritimatiellia bacterium]